MVLGEGLVTRAEVSVFANREAFCALGPVAEAFIAGAPAAGHTGLGPELVELSALGAAHGNEVLLAALDRAIAFKCWRTSEVGSILAAGTGVAHPRGAGTALKVDLPAVPVYRSGR